jgi:hypothetical protein
MANLSRRFLRSPKRWLVPVNRSADGVQMCELRPTGRIRSLWISESKNDQHRPTLVNGLVNWLYPESEMSGQQMIVRRSLVA